jgi:hypothetical protein
MKRADIVAGAFLIVSGLAIIFIVIPNQTSPGEEYGMPPSFLPTLAMVIITGLALILVLQNIFGSRKGSHDAAPLTSGSWRHIGMFSALLFLSLGAIKVVGFIPGGILSITAFMVVMGARHPLIIALVSIPTPVIIYLVLWYALRMPLP